MNEMVSLTGETKSTLIYYVNEGLLPQPQRPKSNVALYEDRCVEMVKLIRYCQKHLYYSITQIKDIIVNGNINFDDNIDVIISSLSSVSIGKKEFSIQKVLNIVGISEEEFQDLKDLELIREDSFYSQKDLEMIELFSKSKNAKKLLKYYAKLAKEIAKFENTIGVNLLEETKGDNTMYQILFDIIFKAKPYIFNNHTLLENKKIHELK